MKPWAVAAIAGGLTTVPEGMIGSPSGPAPRSASEQPAPTLGSLLSVSGTQRASLQIAPVVHAPVAGSFVSRTMRIDFASCVSTSLQPVARTPQSPARATAANEYLSRSRTPSAGGVG